MCSHLSANWWPTRRRFVLLDNLDLIATLSRVNRGAKAGDTSTYDDNPL